MTFDHLVSAKNNVNATRRNIVKVSHPGLTFSYAYLNVKPKSEFGYLNYGKFTIGKDARQLLVALGFDIGTWEKGILLTANWGKNLPSIYCDA